MAGELHSCVVFPSTDTVSGSVSAPVSEQVSVHAVEATAEPAAESNSDFAIQTLQKKSNSEPAKADQAADLAEDLA